MLRVPPDPIDAMVELVKGDPPHTLAGDRVYGHILPASRVEGMPRPTVVIRPTGSARQRRNWGYEKYVRVDIRSYGEHLDGDYVSAQASDLDRQIYEYLTTLTRPQEIGGCVIYAVLDSGGPTVIVDPETNWVVTTSIYDVYTSTVDLLDGLPD